MSEKLTNEQLKAIHSKNGSKNNISSKDFDGFYSDRLPKKTLSEIADDYKFVWSEKNQFDYKIKDFTEKPEDDEKTKKQKAIRRKVYGNYKLLVPITQYETGEKNEFLSVLKTGDTKEDIYDQLYHDGNLSRNERSLKTVFTEQLKKVKPEDDSIDLMYSYRFTREKDFPRSEHDDAMKYGYTKHYRNIVIVTKIDKNSHSIEGTDRVIPISDWKKDRRMA